MYFNSNIEKKTYEELKIELQNDKKRLKMMKNIQQISFRLSYKNFIDLFKELLEYEDCRKYIISKYKKILEELRSDIYDIIVIFMKHNELLDMILTVDFIDYMLIMDHSNELIVKELLQNEKAELFFLDNFEKIASIMYINLDSLFIMGLNSTRGKKIVNDNIKVYERRMIQGSCDFYGFFLFLNQVKKLINKGESFEEYDNIVDLMNKYYSIEMLLNHIMKKQKNELSMKDLDAICRVFRILISSNEEFISQTKKSKGASVLDLVSAIIEDLYDKNADIRFVGRGSFSIVFKIGDRVLKLGYDRFNEPEQTYHPRMLMPHFRRCFSDGCKIEIFNYVDVKDIPKELPLNIYKIMEADNYEWTDPKKENLGRLLKDNDWPEWLKSDTLDIMGIRSRFSRSELEARKMKAGDYGIVDFQHVYTDDDENKVKGTKIDQLVKKYIEENERE